MKKSFTYNTLFMVMANILTRFLGFLYRIFLSRFIGAEGLGLFALISPVYAVCCSLVASGLPVASMKDVSEHLSSGNRSSAKASTYSALFLVLILSLVLCAFILIFAPGLSVLLGDRRTLPSLYILAFAVLITGFENIYKSSFYSENSVKIPAITEIAEQLFRISLVVLLILYYAGDDFEKASFVLTFGIFAGEALSLVILFFSYFKRTRKIKADKISKSFSPLLSTAVPVTLSKTLETVISSASNILVPAMFALYGFSKSESLELLGVISGMVMPLLYLPSVFSNALSVNLVPFISSNLAKGNKGAVKRKTEKILLVTSLFSFPAFFALSVFSKPISEIFFSDSRVALFLPLMSLGALLATFRHIFTSIMNAASMAKKASLYSFSGNAIFLLLSVILIPFTGASGYIFSYIFSNLLLFIPSLVAVFSVIPQDYDMVKKLLFPLLPSIASFLPAHFIYQKVSFFLNPLISLIISALLGAISYLLFLFILLKNKKIIFFAKIT